MMMPNGQAKLVRSVKKQQRTVGAPDGSRFLVVYFKRQIDEETESQRRFCTTAQLQEERGAVEDVRAC